MQEWKYNGIGVRVLSSAEIPRLYRLGAKWDYCVQQALNKVPQWKGSPVGGLIYTASELNCRVPRMIVPVANRKIIWAEHTMHRGKVIEPSPFVFCKEELVSTLTVVLGGTVQRPRLLRAFPGEYAPPLPWQKHVDRKSLGASRVFWRKHAYVCVAGAMREGTAWDGSPDWYDDLMS